MWGVTWRFLRVYVGPHERKFILVQCMHVAATVLMLVPPLLIRYVLDDVIPGRAYAALVPCAGGMVAIVGLWALLHGFKEYWGHDVAQRITSRLRTDLYGHLQKLSMGFHDSKKTGELLSRTVDDINVIQEFTHHGPEAVVIGVVTLLGTGALLLYLDWHLAIVALCLVPLQIIVARRPVGNMLRQFKRVREEKAALSSVLEENLSGVRIIQAFTSEEKEHGNVTEATESHYRTRMGAIRYISMLFPLTMFVNTLSVAAALLYGGIQAMSGSLEGGTLVAFVLYLQRFHQPMLRMMMMAERAGDFFAGMERFFEYVDMEPDIADRPDARDLVECCGEVRFDGVCFRYDDRPILEDVTFGAQHGQMVALVGPSGAGKTTITRLIPRFYDPLAGRVLVDGADVRDLKLSSLRSHIGIVMQDDFLFSGTVAENVGYGRPGASREQIEEAARLGNAAPFVEQLPDGYDTVIGKRGVKLSEGQRQRVSIARALLKNPQILILDEATSSVDSETERLIQEAIERLRAGRTTIAIAHRLSTILSADRILFIDSGRITERGSHEELMALNGAYARFYRVQFGEHALEPVEGGSAAGT
jgi:ATP-binding cassette subfamily B protein